MSLDDELFEQEFDGYWTTIVIQLMDLLGPATDTDLETIATRLRAYHGGANIEPDSIAGVPSEVVRLRGPGYWRDTSPIGLKYRCPSTIAATLEQKDADRYNWRYGVMTALQLINPSGDKDVTIVRRLEAGLDTRQE